MGFSRYLSRHKVPSCQAPVIRSGCMTQKGAWDVFDGPDGAWQTAQQGTILFIFVIWITFLYLFFRIAASQKKFIPGHDEDRKGREAESIDTVH